MELIHPRLRSQSTIVSFLLFNLLTHTTVPQLTPFPKFVGFFGFTVLIYDHLITFGDEVHPPHIATMSIG